MALVCERRDGETWRQCCERYAARYALQLEALAIFDIGIRAGDPESKACWDALCEWDLLDYEPDAPAPQTKEPE